MPSAAEPDLPPTPGTLLPAEAPATRGGLTRYRSLFAVPKVNRLAFGGLIGSASLGMDGFALVLVGRELTGGFSWGGAFTGAYSVAGAVFLPLQGRLVSRHGPRAVLAISCAIYATAMLAAMIGGWLGLHPAAMLPLIAIAGGSRPALLAIVRSQWPIVLAGRRDLQQAAYSLDAIIIDVVFVGGPVIVTIATALGSPGAALVISSALTALGTFWLRSALLRVSARTAGEQRATPAVRMPAVQTLAMMSFGTGFCFGALDVALPAFARAQDAASLSGLPFVAWSAGSILGGIAFGALANPRNVHRAVLVLAAVLPISLLPLLLADSLLALLLIIPFSGLCIAPLLAAANQVLGGLVPKSTLAEAYTVTLSSTLIAAASGAVVSGKVADAHGWRAAMLVGICGGTLVFLSGSLRRATLRRPADAAPAAA